MTPETAASERRRKTHNSIYHHIYRASGICTKQSLARDLGLSLPTIYQHLAELVEDGLVAYSGAQRSTGGRRAAGLSAVDGARRPPAPRAGLAQHPARAERTLHRLRRLPPRGAGRLPRRERPGPRQAIGGGHHPARYHLRRQQPNRLRPHPPIANYRPRRTDGLPALSLFY